MTEVLHYSIWEILPPPKNQENQENQAKYFFQNLGILNYTMTVNICKICMQISLLDFLNNSGQSQLVSQSVSQLPRTPFPRTDIDL